MASATFTLTDDAGQVRLDVNFEGGFDAKSPAHVAGQVLIAQMDKLQADEAVAKAEPSLVLLG